ncbi:MAG: triose-phosphate isomerase [Acidobacteria bacterium]|nr:triose-phosphate isomerase [Acidobacteriota bacterium]
MRRPVIAGNWKMFKTVDEAVETVASLATLVDGVSDREVIVAPTFVGLAAVARAARGTNVSIAAQDCAPEPGQGAFTGEVSAEMLADAGATHVIVGHSERRQFFGETDDTVNAKAKAALGAGLTPIVCVGEQLSDRDAGRAEVVVEGQICGSLSGLTAEEVVRTIVAYEPVWAIGTGRSATPEIAQQMHRLIRETIAKLVGADVSEAIRILYGGSVKAENISALMKEPDIDGGLVGGASLDAESFARIVRYGY